MQKTTILVIDAVVWIFAWISCFLVMNNHRTPLTSANHRTMADMYGSLKVYPATVWVPFAMGHSLTNSEQASKNVLCNKQIWN